VQTFIVRVWVPAEAQRPSPEDLRGIVEHVGSGRSAAFGDAAELVAFLETRDRPRGDGNGDGRGG
jgi:hypothetical protein